MSWLAWAVGLGAGWLASVAGWVHWVGRRAHRADVAAVDALVLLGAKVTADGRASPALAARVDAAARAHAQGLAPWILVSGGAHAGSGSAQHTEASVAMALLRAQGLDAAALVVEDAATSTAENAARAAPLLRGRGAKRVGLVTDDYHLARAALWFRREGFFVVGVPARARLAPATYLAAVAREAVAFSRALLQSPPRW